MASPSARASSINLDRTSAARFSFLLSTPIIAGACAKKFWDLTGSAQHQGGLSPDMHTAFIAGIAASAITGCLAIAFFLNFLRRRSLAVFVWYRIIFGIIVFALAFFLIPAPREMKYLELIPHIHRRNERTATLASSVRLAIGLFVLISRCGLRYRVSAARSVAATHPPESDKVANLIGRLGALISDLLSA